MDNRDNAIVQLFVQNAPFNWLEPYKTPEQMSSTGTAFFIDEQGYLLTNYHVVCEASGIQMQMQAFGKQRLDLCVVGIYPERDIALLKVTDDALQRIQQQCGGIAYLDLGNSDSVERTHEVSCLGFPLGQETLKITQGIMSGYQEFGADFFFQVTAALNPGNSGGPALDVHGKVIGINTAIVPEAQNIGYILPINEVKALIPVLKKTALVRRPQLGCAMNYGTDDLVAYLGNPAPGGIYIRMVYPDSNASNAGIQAGDMLYAIDNQPIDLFGEIIVNNGKMPFASWVNRFVLGQRIACKLYRAGKKVTTTLTLDSQPVLPIRLHYPEVEPIEYEVLAGLVFMELTLNHVSIFEDKDPHFALYRDQRQQYASVIVVTTILQNSLAQKARVLEAGDRITMVNNQPVTTLASLRAALELSQQYCSIQTDNGTLFVFALDAIAQEEEQLAAQYQYAMSACIAKRKR